MNKEEYLAKRNELLATMKAALDAGKVAEAKTARESIEKMDKEYEAYALEMANMAALGEVKIPVTAPVAKKVDVVIPQVLEPVDMEKTYESAFAKFMLGQSLTKVEEDAFDKFNPTAAMTEADHSVLVPHTLRAGIWEEIDKSHPILRRIVRTFIPGDVDIIVETSSGDDATWYDEATAVVDGDTAQGMVTLKGCELAKAIPVSWKLKKMAVNEFMAYIAKKLADKMGNALAAAVINGKGVPTASDTFKAPPKGILTALAAEASTPQILEYAEATALPIRI
jgi:HK97 family phage major capsid protein